VNSVHQTPFIPIEHPLLPSTTAANATATAATVAAAAIVAAAPLTVTSVMETPVARRARPATAAAAASPPRYRFEDGRAAKREHESRIKAFHTEQSTATALMQRRQAAQTYRSTALW
jgi:hypothetical protein